MNLTTARTHSNPGYFKVSGAYANVMDPYIKVSGAYAGNCASLWKKVSGVYQAVWRRRLPDTGQGDIFFLQSGTYYDQWWAGIPDWVDGGVYWAYWNASTLSVISYGLCGTTNPAPGWASGYIHDTQSTDATSVTRYAPAGCRIAMSPKVVHANIPSNSSCGFITEHGAEQVFLRG